MQTALFSSVGRCSCLLLHALLVIACGDEADTALAPVVFERRCGTRSALPNDIVSEVALPRPELGVSVLDPALGGCVTRVTDHVHAGQREASHGGSTRQAWNADASLLVMRAGRIVDAHSFATRARLPDRGAFIWSATDANTLYAVREQFVERIDVSTGQVDAVPVEPLTRIDARVSFHDLSDDGRVTALAGPDRSGGYTLLAYDVNAGVLASLRTPLDAVGQPLVPHWVRVTPSGSQIVVAWPERGAARFQGVESFDRRFRFVGKVTSGFGHGDLVRDRAGAEWYVDFAPDARHGAAYVVKHRVPPADAVSVPLLRIDWSDSVFISCRARGVSFCALSFYASEQGANHPLKNEVALLALDSRPERPNIERLAHHRSDPAALAHHTTAACPLGTSAALPELSIEPRGGKIVFTSNWEGHCFAESYVVVP
ncbi:MAG TPA: hypothetical protein VI072_17475 [Polyangiaceae bacterium]